MYLTLYLRRRSNKDRQRKSGDESGEGYDPYDFDSEGIAEEEEEGVCLSPFRAGFTLLHLVFFPQCFRWQHEFG